MDVATFERSKLDWSESTSGEHAEILALHKSLIALRREHPELSDPSLENFSVEVADDDSWIVMHRGPFQVRVDFTEGSIDVTSTD
jgi:maltooligosyltrehalose trehalohydrolase